MFNTCSGSDVQSSGGSFTVAGLESVRFNNVASITQVKYRAEVAQVVTIGATAYTPTADTTYTVAVFDPCRTVSGYTEAQKFYKYTTPAVITTIGATAADQREYISGKLVTAINAATAINHATAVSLGSGNGFTVTDSGSYYPPYAQNMANTQGANEVYPVTNSDGTGFASTNFSVTTAAVYPFGVGATLAALKPVVNFVYNNVVSGIIEAPPVTSANAPAVSGQNYDGFIIEDIKLVDAITLGGQFAYQSRIQTVYADNGTGSSTSNLSGYQAFERAMLEIIWGQYKNDPSTIYFTGDTGVICGGLGTGLPSGTSLALNNIHFGNGFSSAYYPLGTATIVALTSSNLGIGVVLDVTAGEGVELSAPSWANSLKSAIVGKTPFSIYAKINVTDITGVNPVWVGFRKKAAANATYTAYTDYAFVGLGDASGNIYTSTENDGGGNTNTDTTQNWANNETHTLEVRVDINGAVTFFIDGYKPTVTQTFTFDAGDELIPVFCYALQAGTGAVPAVLEGAFLNTDQWRA